MADLDCIRARFQESIDAKRALLDDAHLLAQTAELADLVVDALRAGGKVILFGNGGSAADATHLAAELVGRFMLERDPLAALSLTDNVSSVTAVANDYEYALTFARQVRGLGAAGDVAVALSTSGRSVNVIRGLEAARDGNLRTVGITGASGGDIGSVADLCLCIPSSETARIQECTMLIGHTVCEIVERALFDA